MTAINVHNRFPLETEGNKESEGEAKRSRQRLTVPSCSSSEATFKSFSVDRFVDHEKLTTSDGSNAYRAPHLHLRLVSFFGKLHPLDPCHAPFENKTWVKDNPSA